MGKKSLFLLLTLTLILPLVSSAELVVNSEFNQGETLMAKVSGNFLDPVLPENVIFYRDTNIEIPLEFDVGEIGEEFYIYAQLLDKAEGNYSISIEGVRYMQGSQVSEEDIVKQFSITNETAIFKITPAFIITEEGFQIEIQNLQNSKQDISVSTHTSSGSTGGFFASLFGEVITDTSGTSFSVKSGEIKKINFNIEEITETSFKTITFSSQNLTYEVPIFISIPETIETPKQPSFKIEQKNITLEVPTNVETKRDIIITNDGETLLNNISIEVSESLAPYINLSTYLIDDLDVEDILAVDLIAFSEEEAEVSGNIKFHLVDGITSKIIFAEVSIDFIKDFVPQDNSTQGTTTSLKSCEELNGAICSNNQTCSSSNSIDASDGTCCLDTCEEKEEGSRSALLGWIIILGLIAFIAWFFYSKYRGTENEVDLFKFFKKK